MSSNIQQSNLSQIFECKTCDYYTSNKKDFNKHIKTNKHKRAILAISAMGSSLENPQKSPKIPKSFTCDICQKEYKDNTGLWRHKKKCGVMHAPNAGQNDTIVGVLMNTIKEQQGMIDKLVDVVKSSSLGTNNSINNSNSHNHTNSHNKTFNLQFFLNETCKDAMNITDFVNSIKLSLQDFENMGELGYAENISQIFLKGLNELDVTKRPIHCSDVKREILHIKDQDKWEKDTDKKLVKNAITKLSNKNLMLMDNWKRENPGCTEYNNRKNDLYLKLMIESLGPADACAEKKEYGKIIKKIASHTIIDKTIM